MRSVEEIIVLAIFLGVIILGGIIGNVLVLAFLMKQPTRKKSSSLLLANLALSDLCLASIVQPYQLVTLIDSSLIEDSGTLCHVGGVISYPFFLVSLGTMVGMCVDRFYALGNPLLYHIRVTFNVALAMVVCPWIYAAAIGIGIGLGMNMEYDPTTQDCGFGWKRRHVAFAVFSGFTHMVMPFTAFLVSNVLIFRRVKSHEKKLRTFHKQSMTAPEKVCERSLEERQRHKGLERRLSLMVNSILTVFLICWTPYVIRLIISASGADIHLPSAIQTGSVWILHANSMINPILYTYFRRDLKNAFVELLRSARCK